MKTTILLFTTIFLIGCDTTLPKDAKTSDATVAPKAGPRPLDAPDSADSPIIISDNSSAFSKTTKTASAINFEKENHMRVYGPTLFAAKVANYQPTWLEMVGSSTPAPATSGCPLPTSASNCLNAPGSAWKISISPAVAKLNWDATDSLAKVNIELAANPQFANTMVSGISHLLVQASTTVNLASATLKVTPATGQAQSFTYVCPGAPCKFKIHYSCATTTANPCGN